MKYSEQLNLAASWVIAARNSDGGWGLNPKQTSSIVNTAEALYILSRAQKFPEDIKKSCDFIRNGIVHHPTERGPRLRYYVFGLLGLHWYGIKPNDPTIQQCAQEIRENQIGNKGWGNSFGDLNPRVFPTHLALWALQTVEDQPSPQVHNGLKWLLAIQKPDGGWGFTHDPDEPSNAVCTAYALLSLRKLYGNDPRIETGKSWLIAHSEDWLKVPIIGESVDGADWHHCSPTWASYALLECGETVFSPAILNSVVYFQTLYDRKECGWRQTIGHVVDMRSMFWAVLIFENVKNCMDPNEIGSLPIETKNNTSIIQMKGKSFGVSFPKRAFTPLLLGFSSAWVILYVTLFPQNITSLSFSLDQMTARIVTSFMLVLSTILLFVGRKYSDFVDINLQN